MTDFFGYYLETTYRFTRKHDLNYALTVSVDWAR